MKGERRMPYYTEAESREIRLRIEEIVLGWPGVTKKMLFGSPAYSVGKSAFVMLVTGGIILTRLVEQEKARLLEDPAAGYFEGHGRVMKKWVRISIPTPSGIDPYIPFIMASYEAARDEMS
jgi:hypothetical protein